LQANSSIKLGTLFTNASIGTSTQIGIINSVYNSQKPSKAFQLYFYSEIKGAFVAYDASLQGGLLNRNSPYTIDSGDLKRFTGQINCGLVLKTKRLYFEYTRTWITREITSVEVAEWGGIKIGFTL
jgi:hypothetical protein